MWKMTKEIQKIHKRTKMSNSNTNKKKKNNNTKTLSTMLEQLRLLLETNRTREAQSMWAYISSCSPVSLATRPLLRSRRTEPMRINAEASTRHGQLGNIPTTAEILNRKPIPDQRLGISSLNNRRKRWRVMVLATGKV